MQVYCRLHELPLRGFQAADCDIHDRCISPGSGSCQGLADPSSETEILIVSYLCADVLYEPAHNLNTEFQRVHRKGQTRKQRVWILFLEHTFMGVQEFNGAGSNGRTRKTVALPSSTPRPRENRMCRRQQDGASMTYYLCADDHKTQYPLGIVRLGGDSS
jgi:hypothetical protein